MILSLYWVVFVVVLLAAVLDLNGRRIVLRTTFGKKNVIFAVILVILFCALAFRYGQGPDYFNYEKWYDVAANTSLQNLIVNRSSYHVDIGWLLLTKLCSSMGFDYRVWIFFLAVVDVLFIMRFAKRYSGHKECVALMMLLPTFILTYQFSGSRQGLVMCLWGGCLLPWLEEKKYGRYIIGCILCSFIHLTALYFLVFWLAKYIQGNSKRIRCLYYACIASFFIGIILANTGVLAWLYSILPASIAGRFTVSISYGANLYRLMMLIIIHYIHKRIQGGRFYEYLYNMYVINCGFFFLFSGYTLFVNRLFSMFGICLEVIFVCRYLEWSAQEGNCEYIFKRRLSRRGIGFLIIAVCTVMFAKNINALASGTKYNLFTYPYVSVWEMDEFENIFPNKVVNDNAL